MTDLEALKVAMKAFDLFTLDERMQALERFAKLRYPKVEDRFFEAVHSVIVANSLARKAVQP